VRIGSILLLLFSLVGCNRGIQNNDAVRQGVIDYLSSRKQLAFNFAAMDVTVTSVQFDGNQADATISFVPKGVSPASGMTMKYQLEQQGDKWVVKGRKEASQDPHGGLGPPEPGAPNPHGGAMPGAEGGAAGAAGKMPAPEDLPPTGKKK
jgi:hypothetical protein